VDSNCTARVPFNREYPSDNICTFFLHLLSLDNSQTLHLSRGTSRTEYVPAVGSSLTETFLRFLDDFLFDLSA